MESDKPQFDVNLGGSSELPIEFSILKYTAARAQEISSLTESLDDPGKTLIFQRLPRCMRRRAMSHNTKRMPRSVQKAHEAQLLQSGGAPVIRKRPSRKYRRRPANLLAEYNRRQRSNVWLETHIWHARRFHMTELWGYRLAVSPTDRSYRACYRAASRHCLLQDVSYLCCVELIGPLDDLLAGLSKHTNPACGPTFAAKSFLDGCREGELMFYECEQYPMKAIGTVTFLWRHAPLGTKYHCIWVWAHPSYQEQVVNALTSTFELERNLPPTKVDQSIKTVKSSGKKQKIKYKPKEVEEMKLITRNVPFERTPKFKSKCGVIVMTLLKDTLNRFRLTGPLSQAVLNEALQLVSPEEGNRMLQCGPKSSEVNKNILTPTPMDIDTIFEPLVDGHRGENPNNEGKVATLSTNSYPISNEKYLEDHAVFLSHTEANLNVHHRYWQSLQGLSSPAELPAHMVLSLVVKDPRLQIPDKRSKAVPSLSVPPLAMEAITRPPPPNSSSIWSANARDEVTRSKLSTAEINALRSKLVVPGVLRTAQGPWNADLGVIGESAKCEIPLLLIQRPGSQDPTIKCIGFGSGWDVILPAGWAMPLWLALIFRCAKPAGLREASAQTLESSRLDILPPDTKAGHQEEERKGKTLRDAYFRLPPNKRPNYNKLGVVCPFNGNWACLLRDWATSTSSDTNFSDDAIPCFYVLRERNTLWNLEELICSIWSDIKQHKDLDRESTIKKLELTISSISDQDHCLLPVKVQAIHRGVTNSLSMICIPSSYDVQPLLSSNTAADPEEPLHEDKRKLERQKTQKAHKALLVRLRRKRVRVKRIQEKLGVMHNRDDICKVPHLKKGRIKKSPTEDIVNKQKEKMQSLWLPNIDEMDSVKSSGSRKTAGFVTKGDFSFSEAKGCGVGYIALQSLSELVKLWLQHTPYAVNKIKSDSLVVLVRSPTSLKYRAASLHVVIS